MPKQILGVIDQRSSVTLDPSDALNFEMSARERARHSQVDEGNNSRRPELFLEQVVKRFAGIVRPDRGKAARG